NGLMLENDPDECGQRSDELLVVAVPDAAVVAAPCGERDAVAEAGRRLAGEHLHALEHVRARLTVVTGQRPAKLRQETVQPLAALVANGHRREREADLAPVGLPDPDPVPVQLRRAEERIRRGRAG